MKKVKKIAIVLCLAIASYANVSNAYDMFVDPTAYSGGAFPFQVSIGGCDGSGNGVAYLRHFGPYGSPYTYKIDTDPSFTDHHWSTPYDGYVKTLSATQSLPTGYYVCNSGGGSTNWWLAVPSSDIPGGTSFGATVVNGKLKIGSHYFCLYDSTYPTVALDNIRVGDWSDDPNYSCPTLAYESVDLDGTNPPPVIPPEPTDEFVNGLTCTTDNIPDASSASWFNYGGLANAYNASDPSVPDLSWVWFGSTSADRDLAIFRPAGTGSVMGTGALTYPGTSTGLLFDVGDLSSLLYIDSIRSGVKTPYNIFQFYNTSNIAFGNAGTFEGQRTDGSIIEPTVMSSSGGVVTGTIANTNAYFDTLIVRYMSRFKGFRIGQAPLVQKKACSINFNICEWSYEGANLQCVSGQNAAGVDFNGCGVTGSGSVYGSGACVPLADSSGNIIPPPAVTGGYVTRDSSGNVVGTVAPPTNSASMWEGVFSCGINTDADDWWETIGKALICPITVSKNFVVRLWNGTTDVQSSLNQINQVSQSALSGTTAMTGSSSYTGSNQLVISMLQLQDETVENKWWKMQSTYFYLFFLMIILGMILSVIYLNKN